MAGPICYTVYITQQKAGQKMSWDEKLREITDYVEDHLQRTQEPVDKEKIVQLAGCSYSFFQKVFSYMNGISFSDYIRCRKMTLAGYDLKSTDDKIIEIGYRYGYDSPTAFTRAFRQFHGMSPQEARAEGAILKVFPKMCIRDKCGYSWRIEKKAAFRLLGKKITVSCAGNQHYQSIPAFWSECQRDGTFSGLISMDEAETKGLMGIFGGYDQNTCEIEYAIMVISAQDVPEKYAQMDIPEMNWAVFDCVGSVPQAIQEGWKFLNSEWLVNYPFRHAPCPEIEWYSSGNPYAEDYLSQIWIPILEEE